MLERMFFYDGNLEDLIGESADFKVIDAKNGYTNNIEEMKKVLRSSVSHLVLTNQVALLNKRWLWDKETHEPKLYLRDKSDGKWKHVSRFTRVDIKYNTGIEVLFRRGEFDVDKAYMEKAKRKRRQTLKLRIERDE